LVGEDHGLDFQKVVKKLADTCVAFATELTLSRERERGYIKALNNEKKKQKRGKPFTEILRAEGDLGVLFFSPRKVERARELQAMKEAVKEDEIRQKELRVEERALRKARKQLEAQQKRDDRVARASSRKATEALKGANRQQQVEAKPALKRSAMHLDTNNTRLTKIRKLQKRPQRRVVVEVEPTTQQPQIEVKSRSGRAIRARSRFEPT
jgi:crotonobetainyl-CoA:carnitine CoA-transferase CaiB-like acyl-CoA transferase